MVGRLAVRAAVSMVQHAAVITVRARIGHTVAPLRGLVADGEVITKDHFSCIAEPGLRTRFLDDFQRARIIHLKDTFVNT